MRIVERSIFLVIERLLWARWVKSVVDEWQDMLAGSGCLEAEACGRVC